MINFDDMSISEVVDLLRRADDLYFNTDDTILPDNEYDILKRQLRAVAPTHPYLIGVGSDVRGGKVKLPYQMGSLDQVEIGEIQNWVRDNNLTNESFVVSDKLDGASIMIVYDDNGDLQIAYSRGNGIEGADNTRHVRLIDSVPKKVSGPLVVRAEAIISVANFEELRSVQTRSSGDAYKNPRNAVSGIMNSKTNKTAAYKYVDIVAYEVVGAHSVSKENQLEQLREEGFHTAPYGKMKGAALTDENLAEYLNNRRNQSIYEIDGVVIDVDSADTRSKMNPTKSTLNPAFAVKYKVASADNIKNVRVVEVEWNVSKHGFLKPRIRIEPTELMGVTIQHCTGFNAKFIRDNKIGPGAVVQITRSGDVIPTVLHVLEPMSEQYFDQE